MAEEGGFTVDAAGFDAAMAAQRERSRAAPKAGGAPRLRFEAEATASLAATACRSPTTPPSTLHPPQRDCARPAHAGRVCGRLGRRRRACTPLGVVLDATPFYAESGGQVADVGSLTTKGGDAFAVADVQVAGLRVARHSPDGRRRPRARARRGRRRGRRVHRRRPPRRHRAQPHR